MNGLRPPLTPFRLVDTAHECQGASEAIRRRATLDTPHSPPTLSRQGNGLQTVSLCLTASAYPGQGTGPLRGRGQSPRKEILYKLFLGCCFRVKGKFTILIHYAPYSNKALQEPKGALK